LTESGQTQQKPSKINDDFCFVAETMIATTEGAKPISEIRNGDLVHTRQGLKPVINCGITDLKASVYSLYLSDGRVLTGTGNHPIYIESEGFKPLRCVQERDRIVSLWQTINANQNQSASFSRELHFTDTRNRRTIRTDITFKRITQGESEAFLHTTLRFGKMLTEKFLKGMKSIIGTGIPLTTNYPTWNLSPNPNTFSNTEGMTQTKLSRNFLPIYQKLKKRLKNGIKARKGVNGTDNKRSGLISATIDQLLKPYALLAQSLFGVTTLDPVFVPSNATKIFSGIINRPLVSTNPSAKFAATSPEQTERKSDSATVLALVKEEARQTVYNITVAEAHEYFANGVLVHNCDAFKSTIALFGAQPTPLNDNEIVEKNMPEDYKIANLLKKSGGKSLTDSQAIARSLIEGEVREKLRIPVETPAWLDMGEDLERYEREGGY
jgi:hypothetical protein